jgi:hypothetical protein
MKQVNGHTMDKVPYLIEPNSSKKEGKKKKTFSLSSTTLVDKNENFLSSFYSVKTHKTFPFLICARMAFCYMLTM